MLGDYLMFNFAEIILNSGTYCLKKEIITINYNSMKRRLLNVTLAMALCVLFASFSANASEKLIKAIDLNAKNVMIGNNHKWKSTSLLKKLLS